MGKFTIETMAFGEPTSATTLSLRYRPGEDLRNFSTAQYSVFTHGNYRIDRGLSNSVFSSETRSLVFDGYETISSINSQVDENPLQNVFVSQRELNFRSNDPNSYVYFGSMKVETSISINNIIDSWPYGVVAQYGQNSATTVYDYVEFSGSGFTSAYSTFKIPYSAVTNPGNVILTSASTRQGVSLLLNTEDFLVQLCGSTLKHEIRYYSFDEGSALMSDDGFMEFEVDGLLFNDPLLSSSTLTVYIRPNDRVVSDFKRQLSPLEYQLLYNGRLYAPNPLYNDGSIIERYFIWPKLNDGLNIDISGGEFEFFKNSLIEFSEYIDQEKTDVMKKNFIPENFLDMDSDNSIYATITQSYAKQFDIIKNYIDNISYAHTVTYDGENSVPSKFLFKLTELLGLRLPKNFKESDLFEYLSGDVINEVKPRSYYDQMLWRRILVNIIWLYKRKGTRDALMFIFKLIGAPDELIRLNEYIYDIEAVVNYQEQSILQTELSSKVDDDGYPNYRESIYAFQEGGFGRGNGRRYIDQWGPEYYPNKRVDNLKTITGSSEFYGTRNVMNTKEIDCALDPAQGIENSVHQYYQINGTCWLWGSEDPFYFDNLNVPFDYVIEDCSLVNPESISGMTLAEWIDFVYVSNVDPRARKTTTQEHNSFHYPELRRIYLNYYLMTEPQSDRLNFKKLEGFLGLIEQNFFTYSSQLIPATSILMAEGTVYRNTIFNRQKFVYRTGINDGSEFKTQVPRLTVTEPITPVVEGVIEESPEAILNPVVIYADMSLISNVSMTVVVVNGDLDIDMSSTLTTVRIEGIMNQEDEFERLVEFSQ